MLSNMLKLGTVCIFMISNVHLAEAACNSSTHPYEACGRCWENEVQATSAGCTDGSNNNQPNDNNQPSDNNQPNNNGGTCRFPGRVASGCRTADTQSWCNTTCVRWVGNGNDGCINQNGEFLSRACVCSDAENDVES